MEFVWWTWSCWPSRLTTVSAKAHVACLDVLHLHKSCFRSHLLLHIGVLHEAVLRHCAVGQQIRYLGSVAISMSCTFSWCSTASKCGLLHVPLQAAAWRCAATCAS